VEPLACVASSSARQSSQTKQTQQLNEYSYGAIHQLHAYGFHFDSATIQKPFTYLLTYYGTVLAGENNSAVHYCSDVSKNRFDLDSTVGQTFRGAIDANIQVKING